MTRLAVAVVAAMLLAGCPKAPMFDLSIPDAPSAVEAASPWEILEQASREGGPSVRARSIVLGLEAAPDRAAWVGRGTYDPAPWVQAQTVRAAAPYLDDDAVRDVVTDYAMRDVSDPYGRAAAAARLPPTEAVRTALADAWRRTREPAARGALAFGALVQGDPQAIDTVTRALARGDVGLELAFLADVGASERPELAAALAEGRDWIEDEMVLAYAAARVALGDRAGRSDLVSGLSHADPLVRVAVVDAVADLARDEAVLRAARRGSPEVVRLYAGMVLDARRGDLSGRFHQALASDDPELRILAVQWAGRLEGASPEATSAARDLARVGLADEDPRVRAASAATLGALGLAGDDRERLQPLLADEDILVRVEAAGALIR